MNADIKKTINKIIFTQAKTFSKALIKRPNTTAVSLRRRSGTGSKRLHGNSRKMKKRRFAVMDRRHINIGQMRGDSPGASHTGGQRGPGDCSRSTIPNISVTQFLEE